MILQYLAVSPAKYNLPNSGIRGQVDTRRFRQLPLADCIQTLSAGTISRPRVCVRVLGYQQRHGGSRGMPWESADTVRSLHSIRGGLLRHPVMLRKPRDTSRDLPQGTAQLLNHQPVRA